MAVGVSVRLQWDPDLGVGPAARDADAFAWELAFRDANYLCTALLRRGPFFAQPMMLAYAVVLRSSEILSPALTRGFL
jgi:hypothetical protein